MADFKSLLAQSLRKIDALESSLAAERARRTQPLAVVGLSCRFPGGDSPASFWTSLVHKRDCIREIPDERLLGPWPKHVPRWAGLIDDVDGFDAEFFGIAPREAQSLDPQQRLLLEVCWEALERAGLLPQRVRGSRNGVFVGLCTLDYQQRVYRQPLEEHDLYEATGIMASTAAGRISYTLGWQGPAVTVDTACSSSLVAIHLACQSLRSGESDLALAGGVNLLLSEVTPAGLARAQALSPDGRCRTFDAAASGYVRGEGCGMVVLKRLADAQRDGDDVLAVVRGSAINQDGRSTGLTAPNVLSQERLLRDALEQAGLDPRDIGYVECHGTGTPLGDPIETDALRSVFGDPRPDGSALWLGAVKTNIGHLEGAAGVAGFIKAVLALQHHELPANLHLRHQNPRVRLDGTPLRLLSDAVSWEGPGTPRRAGVSSFGMSGTNAHVIVEEAPPKATPAVTARPGVPPPLPVVLSARTRPALRAQAARLADHLDAHVDTSALDLAFSLATTRTHFPVRLALAASDLAELRSALRAFVADGPTRAAVSPTDHPRGKLAMLMTGQGSQRPGMGRGLHETFPVFRDALDAVCAELDTGLARPLRPVMFADRGSPDAALLDQTAFTQPALFALEVALFRLWESWGVTPDVLLGHSIGELAAAHVAGVLSLRDACTLVAARARLMQALPPGGAMVSLQASEEEVLAALVGREARVGLAAQNGPLSTVISGDEDAVVAVAAELEARGRKATRLNVSHAFHSPRVDAMLEAFGEVARSLTYHAPRIPIVSNVTGRRVAAELAAPDYWVGHVRHAVRFLDGVRTLASDGVGTWLELGPHGVLSALGAAITDTPDAFVPSLRNDVPAAETIAAAIGALHVRGHEVGWSAFFAPFGARRVDLPTVAFQRERHWIDLPSAPSTPAARSRGSDDGHPLLGSSFSMSVPKDVVFWERQLGPRSLPWLGDHCVQDACVFPGAGYVEMALAAVGDHLPGQLLALEDLVFEQPLVLGEDEAALVQVAMVPEGEHWTIRISRRSSASATWEELASARAVATGPRSGVAASLADARRQNSRARSAAELYADLAGMGLRYGPAFRGVTQLFTGEAGATALGRVLLPDTAGAWRRFILHPALLDGCFHLVAAASTAAGPVVPVRIGRVSLARAVGAGPLWCEARVRPDATDRGVRADLTLWDDSGALIGTVEGFEAQPLEGKQGDARDPLADVLLGVAWREADPVISSAAGGHWLVLCDGLGFGDAVAVELEARGATVQRVPRTERMDPAEIAEIVDAALRRAKASGKTLDGVVVLWALDAPEMGDDGLWAGALHLAQAMAARALRDPPRLVMASHRSQSPIKAERVRPEQALLWGLGGVVRSEEPALRPLRVDLGDPRSAAEARALVSFALSDSDEDQIAIRDGACFVPRLVHEELPAPARDPGASLVHATGSYLITGGLGGLGLSLATWMAEKGAGQLVLLGRTGVTRDEQRQAIAAMQASGARVTVATGDVADRATLAAILAAVPSTHPLKGVVHAAGIVDDALLADQRAERFHRVLGPKVTGAWNLHTLTRDVDLDFFVLYSSAATLLGNPGQASYAAANAFLDSLAHHRRGLGLPAVSLGWGMFDGVGLAAAHETRGARLASRGMGALTTADGQALFARLARGTRAQVAPCPIDVHQWVEFYPQAAGWPYLELLLAEGPRSASAPVPRPWLDVARPDQARLLLQAHIIEQLAQVLRTDPTRIDPRAAFKDLGVDSLMGIELRNRLEKSTSVRLPATAVWTYPTPRAFAELLSTLVLPGDREVDDAAPPHDDEADVFSEREVIDELEQLEALLEMK